MLFLLGNDRKVLLLSFNHDCLALEEIVDQKITYLTLKDVARLVIVPLTVYGTPVAHILHGVVDCLREGGDVIGVLKYGGYFLKIEH